MGKCPEILSSFFRKLSGNPVPPDRAIFDKLLAKGRTTIGEEMQLCRFAVSDFDYARRLAEKRGLKSGLIDFRDHYRGKLESLERAEEYFGRKF